MNRPYSVRIGGFIGILVLTGGSLTAGGFSQESAPPASWNAAVNYWQAFDAIPAWSEAEEKLMGGTYPDISKPLPPETAALIERASNALATLAWANQIERCDWQLNYAEGPGLVLPHLYKARVLARLAILRAQQRFAQGENAAAIDDLLAAIKLARAIDRNPLLISLLVDAAIERQALDVLAAYLPDLTPAERQQFEEGWQKIGSPGTLTAAMQMESKSFGGWLAAQLAAASAGKNSSDSAAEFIKSIVGLTGSAEPPPALADLRQGTLADVAKKVGQYVADCEELVKIAQLPFPERRKQIEQFEQTLAAELSKDPGSPRSLSGLLLPSAATVARREEAWSTRRSMLQAALTGIQNGATGIEAAAKQAGLELQCVAGADGLECSCPLSNPAEIERLTIGGGFRGR